MNFGCHIYHAYHTYPNYLLYLLGCLLMLVPLGLGAEEASMTSMASISPVDEFHWQNLKDILDPCVVQTKQIHIPLYPDAFNASLLAWEDGWLLSFRNKEKIDGVWRTKIGLVKLTPEFEVTGPVSFLDTGSLFSADPRLVDVNGTIYIVYSDVSIASLLNPILGSKHVLEVVVGKIEEQDGLFSIHSICHVTDYPNRIENRVEKNWVPFVYADQLLLAYSLQPHVIFRRPYESEMCEVYAKSACALQWDWGILRGGTPAILVDGSYLSIFHSSKAMRSLHSEGKASRHYFLGAYLFEAQPPFAMQKISPKPIVGRNFYIGKNYPSYWAAIQAVFPCGIVQKGPYLWVSYGRQDHEVWVAQIDTQILLNSLVDVKKKSK